MTTITNNKLTDEKIKIRINEIEDRRSASRDFWDGDYEYPEDIELLALREVLERRKASKEPVRYLNKFSGVCVTLEQQPNASDDVAVYMPLYAATPAPVVPDNWVMVPKEPTRQMMAQGHFAMKGTDRGKFRRIYQAMITAASALNKGEY